LELDHTLKDDDGPFFDSDVEEASVQENAMSKSLEDLEEIETLGDLLEKSSSTLQSVSSPEKDEIIERPITLDISQTEFVDNKAENLVASTPKVVESGNSLSI